MELPYPTTAMHGTAGTLMLGTLLIGLVDTVAVFKGIQEYCSGKSFNATCSRGQVIVMDSARYGRMRSGSCVSSNFGHLGCFEDEKALQYSDHVCSGRRRCEFKVTELMNNGLQPCVKDVQSYLEASYSCVTVAMAGQRCVNHEKIRLTTGEGYISSSVTEETGRGNLNCPWVIEVASGQRINLTLLDFGVWQRHRDEGDTHSIYCHKYGIVREGRPAQETTICAGREREKNVFVSKGNKIEVVINRPMTFKDSPQFILKYQAIGCPLPQVPPGQKLRMRGGVATLTCNNSENEAWTLRCEDGRWTGKTGSCTGAKSTSSAWDHLFGPGWNSKNGILVVVSLGIGLGVMIGILMLAVAVFYLKRKGWKFGWKKKAAKYPPQPVQSPPYETKYGASSTKGYSSGYSSEALLTDGSLVIDPRASNYGDPRHQQWQPVTMGPGQHVNNNGHRLSGSSMGHIYESPDFMSIHGDTLPRTDA